MATTTKISLEQFLALAETKPGNEYVDGEVIQKPMPTIAHAIIQSLVSFVIRLHLQSHPLGEVGLELRCIFGPAGAERAWLPDVVFITAERLQGMPLNGPFRGAPDLAVEILSPDDRPRRVTDKVAFYLAHGVRLVWLIDPEERVMTVFTPGGDPRTLAEDAPLDGGAVLPGFTATVRDLLPRSDAA